MASSRALALAQERPLLLGTPPRDLVAAAEEVATVLAEVIRKQNLSLNLGTQKQPSEHVKIEGWLTAGALMQVFPHTVSTEILWRPTKDGQEFYGVKAVVASKTPDGRVISTADAMCTRDEWVKIKYGERAGQKWYRWADADPNQVGSMAQTRAASKSQGFALRWLITMAGFKGTPAEEMTLDPSDVEEVTPESAKMDPELRQAVHPEGEPDEVERRRQEREARRKAAMERGKGKGKAEGKPATPSPEGQEPGPKPLAWADFYKELGQGPERCVLRLREAFPTALVPVDAESGELPPDYPEVGTPPEVALAAKVLEALDAPRAFEAQDTIRRVLAEGQGGKP